MEASTSEIEELEARRPDPLESVTSRPDPVESVASRPDPAESVSSLPDPLGSVATRPDPVESVATRPDPAESVATRPDPVESTARPDPAELAPPDQIVEDLKEDFKMFDLNGDGKISQAELRTVLHSLGETVTDAEVAHMIQDADANGDGEIDLEEFIRLNYTSLVEKREELQSAFAVFDSDKDGFISAGELHRVLACLGDDRVSIEDCRYMISCVDSDGNQLVDFTEFQTLMSTNPGRH